MNETGKKVSKGAAKDTKAPPRKTIFATTKDDTGFRESPIRRRTVSLRRGHQGISLEDAFWRALRDIAAERGLTIGALVEQIDASRQHRNLSSAIRLFVLEQGSRRGDRHNGGSHNKA